VVKHRLRGGLVEGPDYPAVGQEHDPLRVRGRHRVVSNHHHRLPELSDAAAQQVEDFGAGVGVEVPGRLVREHDGREADQRAGDRDPLLLAAGQLARPVAVSSPARQCSSVDLPEPDGPITAVNDPVAISMLTPSSAVTAAGPLPYRLTRFSVRAACAATSAIIAVPRFACPAVYRRAQKRTVLYCTQTVL
jgi:hypothetical protein